MTTRRTFELLAAALLAMASFALGAPEWPEKEIAQFLSEQHMRPLEFKPGTRLQRDVDKKWQEWFRRVILGPFQKRVSKDAALTQKAARLLEQGALQIESNSLRDKHLTSADLAKGCAEIIKAGVDDPLMHWVHSHAIYASSQNLPATTDAFNKARRHREFALLPASSRYWVLAGISQLYWKMYPTKKPTPSGTDLIQAASETLSEKDAFTAAEDEILDECLWPIFLEKNIRSHEDKVEAFTHLETLTDWTRHMLTGRLHERRAWLARGHTFANGVKPEGWQGFEKHRELAVAAFKQAWELRQDSPLAARELLGIELTGGGTGEKADTWLHRALGAQFDHLSTCRAQMNGLLPRWGGSHEQMLAFGLACADSRRFDTPLPYFFFNTLEDVVRDGGQWWEICRRPLIARVAIALCRQRVADAATPEEKKDALALQGAFGWLCGDYAAAQEALTQNESRFSRAVILQLLPYHGYSEALIRGESAIFSSDQATTWQQAHQDLHARNWESAIQAFETVRGKLTGPGARLASSWLQTTRIEQQLAKGDWVTLPFTPDLDGWQVQKGDWSVGADGTLTNRGKGTSAFIFHYARLGSEVEIRGEFQAGKSGLGVHLGHGYDKGDTERWLTCIMKGDQAYFLDRYYTSGSKTQKIPKLPEGKPVRFEITCRDGKITWKVNDQIVYDQVTPVGFYPPHDPLPLIQTGHIGFCHTLFDEGHLATILKVEVRRLVKE
ncbi:MAG: hypothetical protein IPK32_03390 [Verrucomicrobiaceae bacterium]|nr:hypothetical protein [Verrucomicrobiaceae bacterium]